MAIALSGCSDSEYRDLTVVGWRQVEVEELPLGRDECPFEHLDWNDLTSCDNGRTTDTRYGVCSFSSSS